MKVELNEKFYIFIRGMYIQVYIDNVKYEKEYRNIDALCSDHGLSANSVKIKIRKAYESLEL